MKKFVTLAAVAAFAFAGSASAATTQSQIDALLAQIAALQGGATVSTGATFTYQGGLIRVGSRGQQVRDLQTCLAAKGINASSNIDGIFGSKTAAAVRTFQAQNGVAVDGIIGPVTGPLYTQACSGSTVVVETEDKETASRSDREDRDNDELSGGESSLEDFRFEDESDEVQENDSSIVARAEFDVEDGDIKIERIDLTFVADAGNDEDEPWETFESISVLYDGKVVATEDTSDEDDWLEEDEPFQFRFSGLDIVVEEDEEAVIEFEVEAQNGIDGIEDGETWTMIIEDDGIRGLDGAGIDQFVGDETEEVEFDIEEEGDEDEITLRDSDDDPESSALEVEDDDTSDEFTIFAFDVDVDEDSADVEFDDITVVVEVSESTVDAVFDDFALEVNGESYDDWDFNSSDVTLGGVTYLAEGTGTIALVVFDLDDEDFELASDDVATIELVAEFNSTDEGDAYAEGTTVTASIPSAVADTWDVEGADDLDGDQINGSAVGEEHTLLSEGALIVLESTESDVSSSSEDSLSDTAEFTFTFNAEAFDEPIYVPVLAVDAVLANIVDASTGDVIAQDAPFDSFTITSAGTERVETTDGTEFFRVSSEEDFTVSITHVAGTGTFFAELTNLLFSAVDVTEGADADVVLSSIVLDEDEFTTEDSPIRLLN